MAFKILFSVVNLSFLLFQVQDISRGNKDKSGEPIWLPVHHVRF